MQIKATKNLRREASEKLPFSAGSYQMPAPRQAWCLVPKPPELTALEGLGGHAQVTRPAQGRLGSSRGRRFGLNLSIFQIIFDFSFPLNMPNPTLWQSSNSSFLPSTIDPI